MFTFTLSQSILTGRVSFRWKSLATIYAIFFYIAMTIVVYYVGSERIRILGETKKFDEKIYAYIFVIFLVPHFWIPFVGWGKQAFNRISVRFCSLNIHDSYSIK